MPKRAAPATNATVNAGRHYSDKEIGIALRKSRGLVTIAAQLIGCEPSTIYRKLEKSERLREIQKDAREALVDKAELRFEQAIDKGEAWAIALALKTIGKHRGYVERQEVTGAEGGDLVITVKYEDGANG